MTAGPRATREPDDHRTRAISPITVVALVLIGAIVVLQVKLVAGGQTWSDVRYHTEVAPPRLAAADAIRSGALPAWWDGSGLGVPLAAEPSHGAMYPPTWIAATPHALDLVAIVHLAWAALGVALWARRRVAAFGSAAFPRGTAASDPAAIVAGLLVAASGLLAALAMRGALPAISHLPWVGLCAALLVDATTARFAITSDAQAAASSGDAARLRTRATIGLAFAIGAIALTGTLAILVDAVVLAALIGARKKTWPWLVLSIVAGLAIGAAQWLPAVLALPELVGSPDLHGLAPSRLLELIVPGSFGALADPARGVTAIAGATPWAPSLFVGAPLLALAAVRTPPLRLLVAIAVFAILALVVGRGGWPAIVGAPELHVAAFAIVLAPRAALGIDALLAGERRAFLSLAAGATCSAIALGAVAAQRSRHPDAATAIERALVDGGLGLACMIAALALAWRMMRTAREAGAPTRATHALLFGLLALPSLGASPSTAPTMPRSIVDEAPPFADAALRVPDTGAPQRAYRPEYMFAFDDKQATLPETPADAIGTFAGASSWRWGIAAARSVDPARLPVHDRFWLSAASEGGALLDRFGITLAILPETVIVPRKLAALAARGKWVLVSIPVAAPAGVHRGARWVVDPDDAMNLMYPGGGGIGTLPGTVVLKGRGEAKADRGPPLPCQIERWDAGVIDLSCTTDVPGYAAISSSAHPGWAVTVDGEPRDWLTADVLRRAVEVPAGTHRIAWRYRAPGLRVGVLVAIVAILGLIALALAARVPRRA